MESLYATRFSFLIEGFFEEEYHLPTSISLFDLHFLLNKARTIFK